MVVPDGSQTANGSVKRLWGVMPESNASATSPRDLRSETAEASEGLAVLR
jgi:hypothetical protein